MAGFIRASARGCYSRSLLSSSFPQQLIGSLVPNTPIPAQAHISPFHSAISPHKSPLENNMLRILRTEIDYLSQYASPHQPVKTFDAFMVEDRPGEQFVTLRRKFAADEHIKIEATMFDGSSFRPKSGDENSGQDVQLHISLLVDIWKEEGHELMEFLCSAWPDVLEVQNVYIFKRDGLANKIYMGPNVRDLKDKLRNGFIEFLKERGVTDDLAIFLHKYMMNKDRVELIQWLGKVEFFIEK